MRLKCANCDHLKEKFDNRSLVVNFGYYFRKSDGALIKRYRCNRCLVTFSDATSNLCFNQKKRHINRSVMALLCGGYSQRRTAFELKLNRKTVARKLIFLGVNSKELLTRSNQPYSKAKSIQFDDLETFEHSKSKPLSVILAVESKTRRILNFQIAKSPPSGRHSNRALKKYGKRQDERAVKRKILFRSLKELVTEDCEIKCDENPHYRRDLANEFPKAKIEVFHSRKSAEVGQGELKVGANDPLFSINHTLAMLRANINRLFRKTWCTTKRQDCLELHLAMFCIYFNEKIRFQNSVVK